MSKFAAEGFEAFDSPIHGQGLRSLHGFRDGDIIFTERPLHMLQTIPNRGHVLVCGNCHGFLGGPQEQMDFLSRKFTRMDDVAALMETAASASGWHCMVSSCTYRCGEYYCSPKCRDCHWLGCHSTLCTGVLNDDDAETSPLLHFKLHAMATNEIFLMVAELFSRICDKADSLLVSGELSLIDALEEAASEFTPYVRPLWWEAAVDRGENKYTDDTAEGNLATRLQSLVMESWTYLDQVLRLGEKGFSAVLNQEFMSRTIGMFEQNNVGVRLQTPLSKVVEVASRSESHDQMYLDWAESAARAIDEESEGCCEDSEDGDEVDQESGSDLRRSVDTGDEEIGECPTTALSQLLQSEGLDRLFPPLDGTAFYLNICKINHSCVPNVIVTYTSDDSGLHAAVKVLRTIEAGDELVQSYIDQSMKLEERQSALLDYGFSCCCSKCMTESSCTDRHEG